jgi:hypothetical protein
VIINFGGSRENIRRFAREIMPAFSDEPGPHPTLPRERERVREGALAGK